MTSEPSASGPHPAAPQATERQHAVAATFFALSPFVVAFVLVLFWALSEVSLAMLWHHFEEGGAGMWVLTPLLGLGVLLVFTLGLLALLRASTVIWPLLVVPTLALLGGLYFERAGEQRALEAVEPGQLDAMTQLRIFAEGVSEASNTRALGFFVAALLLTIAALSVAGHALQAVRHSSAVFSAHSALPKPSVRALGVGLVCVLGCLAYAFGSAPHPIAVGVVASGVAFAAVACALVGATPETTDAQSTASSWLLQMAAFSVSAQLCFAGFWDALAHDFAFAAIGGESVPDNLAATRLEGALRMATWCQTTLLGLALLPSLVVLARVLPPLANTPSKVPFTLRLWPGGLALLIAVLGLGAARVATGRQLDHGVAFEREAIPAGHAWVIANGGRAQRFGSGVRGLLWVGKDTVELQPHRGQPSTLPATSMLLDPRCAVRYTQFNERGAAPEILLDESLSAQHMQCLMIALLKLETDPNSRAFAAFYFRETEFARPLWILRAPQPALPTPYDALVLRGVELTMGLATHSLREHLELHATHWQLQTENSSLRISGDVHEQGKQLVKVLTGLERRVSIAAQSDLPVSVVLNAGLAVADAGCEPQLWLSGYSASEQAPRY